MPSTDIERYVQALRAYSGMCPNCGGPKRLTLCADGHQLEVCIREGCGVEECNEPRA